MLLSTFTMLWRDVEDRIVEYGYGNLRVDSGLRRMGLLVLIDTGVCFLPETDNYVDAMERSVAANWSDIAGVGVKKKLLGQEITLTTRTFGRLTSRVTGSPSLGSAIEAAWRAATGLPSN